jgi:hypothetical protein
MAGELWVGNNQYQSQVNYCPYCDHKAETQVVNDQDRLSRERRLEMNNVWVLLIESDFGVKDHPKMVFLGGVFDSEAKAQAVLVKYPHLFGNIFEIEINEDRIKDTYGLDPCYPG